MATATKKKPCPKHAATRRKAYVHLCADCVALNQPKPKAKAKKPVEKITPNKRAPHGASPKRKPVGAKAKASQKATSNVYPFTAEDIIVRKQAGKTWAQVAEELGVGTTYCRGAYRALTGNAPSTLSTGAGARAPRKRGKASERRSASPAGTPAAPAVDRNPHWNADSDQDELIKVLEPVWEIGSKGMRELKERAIIRTERTCANAGNYVLHDEFGIQQLIGFKFDADGRNLLVEFHDDYSGGYHCLKVQDIVEVAR